MSALLIAALAVFAAQLVKGTTGFGAALVAVPVLAMVWSVPQAMFLTAFTDLAAGVFLLFEVHKRIRWTIVAAIGIPVLVGMWVGTGFLLLLSEDTLLVLMGVIVAMLGAQMAVKPVSPGLGECDDLPDSSRMVLVQAATAGLLGGIMGGTVGFAGPPVVVWARRWFTDMFIRAQLIAVFLIVSIGLPVMLMIRGAVPTATIWKLPWLLAPMAIGVVCGAWLAPRLSRVAFGRVVGVVLASGGLLMLVRAVGLTPW